MTLLCIYFGNVPDWEWFGHHLLSTGEIGIIHWWSPNIDYYEVFMYCVFLVSWWIFSQQTALHAVVDILRHILTVTVKMLFSSWNIQSSPIFLAGRNFSLVNMSWESLQKWQHQHPVPLSCSTMSNSSQCFSPLNTLRWDCLSHKHRHFSICKDILTFIYFI